MGREALAIGADTMQFFLRNPRGSAAKPLDAGDLALFRKLLEENGFGPVLAHAPYTLNACSADPRVRDRAIAMLAEDLERMQHLPGNYYVMHPGSHVGQGADSAIPLIASAINAVLRPGHDTVILLETMSGKGTEVGQSFEELKAIRDRVAMPSKVGICFDACHLFASGHDIVNRLDDVLDAFDRVLGIDALKAVHLNDSLHAFHSRKDRHTAIGSGYIGRKAIIALLTHPLLSTLPFITETPLDLKGHAAEISDLRSACLSQMSR